MKEIFKNKRSVYYSLVVMLTLVVGLVGVTFAYYVPDSEVGTEVTISTALDQIQSDELVDGSITVEAGESKEFTLNVVSGSDIETSYKVYYTVDSTMPNVDVYADTEVSDTIKASSVLPYNIHIDNYGSESITVHFDIVSGVIGTSLDTSGHELGSTVIE